MDSRLVALPKLTITTQLLRYIGALVWSRLGFDVLAIADVVGGRDVYRLLRSFYRFTPQPS